MSEKQLHFKTLTVRRMPGFEMGFSLQNLQPGLNIIYGPNGSGKTTLVRAMMSLLWPELAPDKAEVSAQCALDGASWYLDCGAGYHRCEKAGKSQSLPLGTTADLSARYLLSLHDLLVKEDRHFARIIAQEMAGGYDVRAAAKSVGAKGHAAGAAIGEARAYKNARNTTQRLRREQEKLENERLRLQELQKRRDGAREAKHRVEIFQLLIEHRSAADRLQAAEAHLETFPPQMSTVRADDEERVMSLKEKLADKTHTKRLSEHDTTAARRRMAQSELPDGGVPPTVFATLEQIKDNFAPLQEEIKRHRSDFEAAKGEMKQARHFWGDLVTDAQLAQVDNKAFTHVAQFARKAEKFRVQQYIAQERLRRLEREGDEVGEELDDLRQGRVLLSQWLRAGKEQARTPLLPLILLLLSSALLTLAALPASTAHPIFLIMALPGVILFIAGVYLLIRWVSTTDSARIQLQKQFAELSIDPIDSWEAEAVQERLKQLENHIIAVEAAQQRAIERQGVQEKLEELQEVRRSLQKERQALIEQLGIAPDVVGEIDESALFLLAENLNRWQQTAGKALQVDRQLKEVQSMLQEKLKKANSILVPYGYEATQEVEAVRISVADLKERQQRYQDAKRDLQNIEKHLNQVADEIEQLTEEYNGFFLERNLEPGDEGRLRELLQRLPDWEKACQERDEAAYQYQSTKWILDEHPEFAGQSREELEQAKEAALAQAGQEEAIIEEIKGIEARVETAKSGHALEEALVHEEACAYELQQRRDDDYFAVTAHFLSEFLQTNAASHTMPAVFRRAHELFATITKGQYQLYMSDDSPPTFRAIDSLNGGRSFGLEELSSGTRLQLLLAVRMAFVIEQEHGLELPLFLDETLGNSDEARAQTIIEAGIQLAQTGRQVLYFTAQLDEVNKWKAMGGDGVNVIDLARVRRLAGARSFPLPVEPFKSTPIPSPDGASYLEYGQMLAVPGINPRAESSAGVHLWHVLDDVQTLYQLLQNNIQTIGQLRTLHKVGLETLPAVDVQECRQALACAKAIDEALYYCQIGRGKLVDRQVLLASGAVSNAFIQEVSKLAEKLHGNGPAIIEALKNGAVPGFRRSKYKQLRRYFIEKGYIDLRQPLEQLEIQLRVKNALQPEIEAGLVSTQRIDVLVNTLLSAESFCR